MIRLLRIVALALVCSQTPAHAAGRVDELTQAALRLRADPAAGAIVYRESCAACHGVAGEGKAADFIPALAGQRARYIVKQLAAFSQRERDVPTMHAAIARKPLNAPQTWRNVATFVSGLSAAANVQTGRGEKILLGEAVFREQCSSCHGEDARGDDEGFIPALRNQHYSYLLREMQALAAGYHRSADPDLSRFLASIHEDEMRATADYLSRLKPAAAQR